jgi:hypothetical protein
MVTGDQTESGGGAESEGEGRGMQSGREQSDSRMRDRTESDRGRCFRRRKSACLGRWKGACRLWRKDRAHIVYFASVMSGGDEERVQTVKGQTATNWSEFRRGMGLWRREGRTKTATPPRRQSKGPFFVR